LSAAFTAPVPTNAAKPAAVANSMPLRMRFPPVDSAVAPAECDF
jgi:hypothetical protein